MSIERFKEDTSKMEDGELKILLESYIDVVEGKQTGLNETSVTYINEDQEISLEEAPKKEDLFLSILSESSNDSELFSKMKEARSDIDERILLESLDFNLYEKYKNNSEVKLTKLERIKRKIALGL